ncbi:hypothetical protein EJB05_50920, partial [Eragrostis curvula]
MLELFEYMDQRRPKVLINTFEELEPTVVAEMKTHMDVFAVGPMVGSWTEARIHCSSRRRDRERYMDWLGTQPEKSVVYVSFGSVSKYKRQQMEEVVSWIEAVWTAILAGHYIVEVEKIGKKKRGMILVASCMGDRCPVAPCMGDKGSSPSHRVTEPTFVYVAPLSPFE